MRTALRLDQLDELGLRRRILLHIAVGAIDSLNTWMRIPFVVESDSKSG